jgi:hypothetical protein
MIRLLLFLMGIFIAIPAALGVDIIQFGGVDIIQLGYIIVGSCCVMCTVCPLYDLGCQAASIGGASRLWLTIGTLVGYVFWLVMFEVIRMSMNVC